VNAVRIGGEPPPRVDDDTRNALIYETYRDRPAAEILAGARDSWDHIAAAIEACSEDDLLKPHPQVKDQNLLDTGPANGGHLGLHLMFWHLEAGNEEAAEAAARWAYGLETDAAANGKARAYASYNLACFYGRVGRAGPALPLLRESFQDAPELLDLARTDPDLDPIRNDAELVALLS
jgi:hypothetical protein